MDTLPISATILEELGEWRRSSEEATRYSLGFYDSVERIVRSMSRSSISAESANARYQTLQRLIFDSGPLSPEFLPSLVKLEAAISAELKR